MIKLLIIVLINLIEIIHQNNAKYILSIHLFNYKNYEDIRYDGGKCEKLYWLADYCDPIFRICVSASKECDILKKDTKIFNNKREIFSVFSKDIELDVWSKKLSVKVIVDDIDNYNNIDHIAIFRADFLVQTLDKDHQKTLLMIPPNLKVQLQGSVSLKCSPGFYGSTCDKGFDEYQCMNNCIHGTCLWNGIKKMYFCLCYKHWTGIKCHRLLTTTKLISTSSPTTRNIISKISEIKFKNSFNNFVKTIEYSIYKQMSKSVKPFTIHYNTTPTAKTVQNTFHSKFIDPYLNSANVSTRSQISSKGISNKTHFITSTSKINKNKHSTINYIHLYSKPFENTKDLYDIRSSTKLQNTTSKISLHFSNKFNVKVKSRSKVLQNLNEKPIVHKVNSVPSKTTKISNDLYSDIISTQNSLLNFTNFKMPYEKLSNFKSLSREKTISHKIQFIASSTTLRSTTFSSPTLGSTAIQTSSKALKLNFSIFNSYLNITDFLSTNNHFSPKNSLNWINKYKLKTTTSSKQKTDINFKKSIKKDVRNFHIKSRNSSSVKFKIFSNLINLKNYSSQRPYLNKFVLNTTWSHSPENKTINLNFTTKSFFSETNINIKKLKLTISKSLTITPSHSNVSIQIINRNSSKKLAVKKNVANPPQLNQSHLFLAIKDENQNSTFKIIEIDVQPLNEFVTNITSFTYFQMSFLEKLNLTFNSASYLFILCSVFWICSIIMLIIIIILKIQKRNNFEINQFIFNHQKSENFSDINYKNGMMNNCPSINKSNSFKFKNLKQKSVMEVNEDSNCDDENIEYETILRNLNQNSDGFVRLTYFSKSNDKSAVEANVGSIPGRNETIFNETF